MRYKSFFLLFSIVFFLTVLVAGCHEEKKKEVLSPNQKRAQLIRKLSRFSALPVSPKYPQNNPPNSEKIALGKLLFFDPILSGDKDVACATCHHPANGFAESLDISIGVNGQGFGQHRAFRQPNNIPFTKRNSQTILNTAFNGINNAQQYEPESAPMFWDLRAKSLESQALEPIKAKEEMRGNNFEPDDIITEIIKRLNSIPEYQERFELAFHQGKNITQEKLAMALATYERSLLTNNSRFDQFMRGDESAISLAEIEGFELFKQSGCGNCHNGPMFSDFKPHVLGVRHNNKLIVPDKGIDSTYAFRTPSLRNLRFTFPYMHNGSQGSLEEVLEFYEDIAGGVRINEDLTRAQLDPLVNEIRLKVSEMRPIISFLNTLNDNNFDKSVPTQVPSGLPVGGNIH